MPQRKKSRSELALSGALKKNAQRYGDRYDAPAAAGVGYAPRHLSATQKILWREIVNAAPQGVLTAADKFAVELAVKMVERCRQQLPKPSEIAVLMNLLGRLGLTPADRARLNIAPAPETSEEDPGRPCRRLSAATRRIYALAAATQLCSFWQPRKLAGIRRR